MLDDPFTSGQLLLPDTPPEAVAAAGEGLSLAASLLVAASYFTVSANASRNP